MLTFITHIKSDIIFVPLFFNAFVNFLAKAAGVIPLFFIHCGILTALRAVTRLNDQFAGVGGGGGRKGERRQGEHGRQTEAFA
ncbi:hypothetical protein D3C81_1657710 [compost metagenome]